MIKRIWAFGSYLKPETTELAYLDLAIELEPRPDWDQRRALDYADASGRTFGTFIDRLFWPSKEVR